MREWEDLQVLLHRFGGKEFYWGKVEIGHVHTYGMVDIPFNKWTHTALVERGLAQRYHMLDDSGWIATFLQGEQNLTCVGNCSAFHGYKNASVEHQLIRHLRS
jgi:hypothetical protein